MNDASIDGHEHCCARRLPAGKLREQLIDADRPRVDMLRRSRSRFWRRGPLGRRLASRAGVKTDRVKRDAKQHRPDRFSQSDRSSHAGSPAACGGTSVVIPERPNRCKAPRAETERSNGRGIDGTIITAGRPALNVLLAGRTQIIGHSLFRRCSSGTSQNLLKLKLRSVAQIAGTARTRRRPISRAR